MIAVQWKILIDWVHVHTYTDTIDSRKCKLCIDTRIE